MAAPDFAELGQNLHEMGAILQKAGKQVSLVPNIIPDEAELSVADRLKNMDEKLTDIKGALRDVHNLAAHAVNGQARQMDKLAVLKDQEGRDIAGFPSTKADVDNLKKDDMIALLRSLGADTDGTLEQLKKRFKTAINIH